MKAGIIAAGDGSRLKSEGISVPKPLVPVDGVPLIERLLSSFVRCGISEVVFIVNEYSLEVKRYVEELRLPIPVTCVVETTPSSMHSLFALAPHLLDGQFLLSTVDSIFDEGDLAGFLHYAQQRTNVDGVLAVTDYVEDENPLYVRLDPAHRIVGFGANGAGETPPWVTGGLYIFSPRIFQEIDTVLKDRVLRLRYFLTHLVRRGYMLEAFPFSKIVDVDHVNDIKAAEALLRGRS